MLDATDQHQFTIAGASQVSISTITSMHSVTSVNLTLPLGTSACNFYDIRTSPLRLLVQSDITLLWPKHAGLNSFSIRSSGALSGTITAIDNKESHSSYQCSDDDNGGAPPGTLQGPLSDAFDSSFLTKSEAQLNYHSMTNTLPGENQVRVSGEVHIYHVDFTASNEEKATLLEALPNEENKIVFDDFSRSVPLNINDLVVIRPATDFYIRKVVIDRGIQVECHGTVKDILVGAGSRNYKSCMPSLFDTLDRQKRLFTVIPSIVAFILGLLEAVGLLPKKR
jgi:hypothetical protein